MGWYAKPLLIAAALATGCAVYLAPPVLADDTSVAKKSSSSLDQQINQAVGSSGGASSSDLDARVRDLDSTRTAIEQQKKPTVSLSVSGWVDQQVQYNMK